MSDEGLSVLAVLTILMAAALLTALSRPILLLLLTRLLLAALLLLARLLIGILGLIVLRHSISFQGVCLEGFTSRCPPSE
jgi:hypothetical protein